MSKSGFCVGTVVALIAFVFVGANVSERYIGNAVNKDYPGQCYYNDTKTPINVGATYKPTSECVQIYCREDFVLHLVFCPRYMLGDGCTVRRNEGAEYPDCCPQIDCPKRP